MDEDHIAATLKRNPSLGYVWFSFKGRINRKTYWCTGVIPLTGVVIGMILLFYYLWPPGGYAAAILLYWGGFAISVKRWHDRNKSAWWLLIVLVPLLLSVVFLAVYPSAYWFVLVPFLSGLWAFIELGFLAGKPEDGPNRYGPAQR